MGIQNKIAQYRAYRAGVKHCTFNPDGPGVVRIHLVPPSPRLFRNPGYIVILNGYYLLPLGYSWAVLLSALIDEVNAYDGQEMGEEEIEALTERTIKRTRRVYPTTDASVVREDLSYMMDVLFEIARGGDVDEDIEKLSIRSYAKHMGAPHRMDLMIRAMTDAQNCWQCNQKCLFCYAAGQSYAKVEELSTDEWKRAIDKLRASGVPMLTFTGGEPTQRADLAELVAYAKWFVTRVNTNGVLLTPELAAQLKQGGLDSLQITLYSSDEEIHNKLVGSTHHADTLRGIEAAVAAGLDVSINTPLCSLNADYMATLSLIHSLGVRFVTISGLICTGTALQNHEAYDLTEHELIDILRAAKAFCDEHDMEMDFTSPGLIAKNVLEELGLNVPSCGAALSNMAIAPDGTVVPCQSWLSGEAGLGNILTDRWKNIWKHPLALSLRRMSDREALLCPFRTNHKEVSEHGKE
jgi:MoaA/NifB/PqqE/SkfB family radical SAM enzyme